MLIVTDHQVVFHCDTAHRSESLPIEKIRYSGAFAFGYINLGSKSSSSSSCKDILETYSTMVSEYTSRRLSYQTDVENAFSGMNSILKKWCKGEPVIAGILPSFFSHSMLWHFKEGQDDHGYHSRAEIGRRRKGFPSWSWVGWVSTISNINKNSSVELPLLSLMRNIEITNCSKTTTESLSLNFLDESANEENAEATGQQIRINLQPMNFDPNSDSFNTLVFEAERTQWNNFTVKALTDPGPVFYFGLSGKPTECGFLSIAPDEELVEEVSNQETKKNLGSDCSLSLVRLYRLRLKRCDKMRDETQELLHEIEDTGMTRAGYSDRFRRRLERSGLIFILLIRRCNLHWERVGSGLMFQKDWPSASPRAKVRAYQEKIVLV